MTTHTTPTAYGLEIAPLDEATIPLEVIALVKGLDVDGDPCITVRFTEGLNAWDRVGILTIALDRAREDACSAWVGDEDEDEDDAED